MKKLSAFSYQLSAISKKKESVEKKLNNETKS